MADPNTIHILPEDIANKIAAGEVIERPASVVKELVENAVDAGATRISVLTEAAGMKKIQVVDNGSGMSAPDLALAIIRHATSKIATDQDLKAIATLGFRGEALPSIAAVSHMEIVSRRQDEIAGSRIYAEGGKVLAHDEIGSGVGTTVTVSLLFFNTPARKEFMKTAPAENAAISEMITRFALAHPGIAFSLISDGQKIFQSAGKSRMLDVVADVYGTDIARKMIRVLAESTQKSMAIEGFAAPPLITRSNRKHILTFINNRCVKSQVLDDAVMEAYETLLPLHRFPVCILSLHLNPEEIDVNVHPAKLEVRFHNEEEIHAFVADAVRTALMAKELIPDVFKKRVAYPQAEPQQGTMAFQTVYERLPVLEDPHDPDATDHPSRAHEEGKNAQILKQHDSAIHYPDQPDSAAEEMKILGQVFRTYILVERKGELLIIDQHAAQERTMYERMLLNLEREEPAQQLLVPLVLELDPTEDRALQDYASALTEVGFTYETASGRSIFLREIPMSVQVDIACDLFRSILANVGQMQRPRTDSADKREAVMRAACRASVKANDTMSSVEMTALVQQLLHAENSYTCPHGRPTMLRLSKVELEKMFKRI
jgi:DNA mismatch repair protein MutL